MDLYELLQGHAALFLLLMARVSGIFIITPFFGSMNVPVYFRAGMTFVISLLLYPVVEGMQTVEAPGTALMYAVAIAAEIFIGWLIGMVAYISFSAIHMGGKVMDMQAGFSMVNVMDPTSGQQIPLIGSFLYNLGVMIFLVTNGHHMILNALVGSFQWVPILGIQPDASLAILMANFTAGIFLTGMKIAMPVTFAILLTNVGMGILARTMPQLNIFVVGIPLHIMLGLGTLMMVLPFYVMFLDVLFDEMYGHISAAVGYLR
ncbi:MAG: flagellar type III secretion system protein FliR [Selenomonadaceae bacterium]|nr:flagellar type III secretion system protein FliR [Selenomonadaceae bacterium]